MLTLPVMALRAARDIDATAQILGLDADALRAAVGAPAAGARARRAQAEAGERGGALGLGRGLWVVALKDGREVPTPVETGITDLDRVEITGGLAEGDEVLLLPTASLVEIQQQIQDVASRRGGIPGLTQQPAATGASRAAPAAGALMPFWETVRLALDSMRGNAFRSALTMLGVIIGVAAVIAMLALGRGAKAAVDEQLATLGADVLTVTTGMRWMSGVARDQQTLTLDDAAALARDARHIAAVVPEQSGRQQVRLGARNLNLQVIGTLPEHARVNGYEIEYGRMFTAVGRRRAPARRGARRRGAGTAAGAGRRASSARRSS